MASLQVGPGVLPELQHLQTAEISSAGGNGHLESRLLRRYTPPPPRSPSPDFDFHRHCFEIQISQAGAGKPFTRLLHINRHENGKLPQKWSIVGYALEFHFYSRSFLVTQKGTTVVTPLQWVSEAFQMEHQAEGSEC